MANELQVTIGLRADKANLKDEIRQDTDLVDMATGLVLARVDNIPTTAGGTVVSTTGITTLGWAYFKNLDATNFVKIGPESGGAIVDFIKLKPGEHATMRLMTGITLRAISDTAACNLLIHIYND